jgi:hypothetical protein
MSWHKDIKLDDKTVLTLNYHNYSSMNDSGIESFYTAIINSHNHAKILYMGREKDVMIQRVKSGIANIKPFEEIENQIKEML